MQDWLYCLMFLLFCIVIAKNTIPTEEKTFEQIFIEKITDKVELRIVITQCSIQTLNSICYNPKTALKDAFDWNNTPREFNYWQTLNNKYF